MKVIFYSFVLSMFICACKNDCIDKKCENEIIAIDLCKEYPGLDIKLSDLADVSFIALGGSDSVNILTDVNEPLGRYICIDGDLMIIGDCSPSNSEIVSKCNNEIYLFDTCGHFLRSFGDGTKKANALMSFKNMCVFPGEDKVLVYSTLVPGVPLVVYDYTGKVVGTDTLDKTYLFSIPFGKNLVLYDHHSQFISMLGNKYIDRGRTVNVYNIETGDYMNVEDIVHKNIRDDHKLSVPAQTHLYSSGNKVYISSPRTDTVYVIDDNLNISPKFVSTNNHGDNPQIQNIVCPLVETPEYIIFCNSMDYHSQVDKRFKFGIWIYVKQEQKIYQISDMGYIGYKESRNNATYVSHLLNDEIFLSPFFSTQNRDILICALSPQYLLENFKELPAGLQEIAANIRKDDNPVLMVMKFGKQLHCK